MSCSQGPNSTEELQSSQWALGREAVTGQVARQDQPAWDHQCNRFVVPCRSNPQRHWGHDRKGHQLGETFLLAGSSVDIPRPLRVLQELPSACLEAEVHSRRPPPSTLAVCSNKSCRDPALVRCIPSGLWKSIVSCVRCVDYDVLEHVCFFRCVWI